jgi:hypothetical protein
MMDNRLLRALSLAAALFAPTFRSASAELFLNEMHFDPGGSGQDNRDEFIELRGTPGMSLDNTFLLFIESEDNIAHTGGAGLVENIFALGDDPSTPEAETPFSIGSNGFLTLRQKGTLYANPPSGTTDLVNTGTGAGWGSGATSTVRHTGEPDATTQIPKVVTENAGFTVMLIRNNGDPTANKPMIGLDLDVGNDGLDSAETALSGWRENWTIIDSLGIFGEFDEATFGRAYGKVNFGPENTQNTPGFVPNIEPGAEYQGVGYEIEYFARWGNSTGQTVDDWSIGNLTDRASAGSTGPPDFRQSGDPHPSNDNNPLTPPAQPATVETNKGVPYGTKQLTLGAPNFLLGDYNKDGQVNAADYTVWRDTIGQTGSDSNQLAADADHNYVVGPSDYQIWKNHFGEPFNSSGEGALSGGFEVPEPAGWLLVTIGISAVGARNRRRQTRC